MILDTCFGFSQYSSKGKMNAIWLDLYSLKGRKSLQVSAIPKISEQPFCYLSSKMRSVIIDFSVRIESKYTPDSPSMFKFTVVPVIGTGPPTKRPVMSII